MVHLGKAVIDKNYALLKNALSSYLRPGQRYAIVDYPEYSNVGDSLIWLGQIQLLRKLAGANPDYSCDHHQFNPHLLRTKVPDGPIFLNGGGNFGDLYEPHMELRYKIMREFPDRQIIQLPQSIYFADQSTAKICRDHIARHGRFKVMVRDHASLRIAINDLGCEDTVLLPDCAFALGALSRTRPAEAEYLYMMRDDVERVEIGIDTLRKDYSGPRHDWLSEPPDTNRRSYPALFETLLSGRVTRADIRVGQHNAVAWRRAQRGMDLLSKGNVVICDRLHVHILCVLMNIPHVALDNSYRKIHNFIEAWMEDCPLVRKATSIDEVKIELENLKNLPR